jgi:electron transport complex protein RnfB
LGLKRQNNVSADKIDALLPQTQCGKCGFAGCRPYAEALSVGLADINQCPPGGDAGVRLLAELLGVAAKPLNPAFGVERGRLLAVIDEGQCIGCTQCIPPCPVDAIIGAPKYMHGVIAMQCTGCELCIEPCPVSCIRMEVHPQDGWGAKEADSARQRYLAKQARLLEKERLRLERFNRQKQLLAARLQNVSKKQ